MLLNKNYAIAKTDAGKYLINLGFTLCIIHSPFCELLGKEPRATGTS